MAVIEDYHQLGSLVLWAWVAGGAWSLPFVVGFMSQRPSTAGPHKSLRNAVLRFGDDRSATSAAQGFFDKAMAFPRRRHHARGDRTRTGRTDTRPP